MSATFGQDKSLAQLEREAERNRALLSNTVDELRDRVTETATDLRERISPASLKAEVKDYARETGQSWLNTIETRARENPLQALAIGAGLAYPLWRIISNIPAPILLLGAGVALSRPSNSRPSRRPADNDWSDGTQNSVLDDARQRVSDVAGNVKSVADDLMGQVQDAASRGADQMTSVLETAQSSLASGIEDAKDAASNAVEAATRLASDTGTKVAATMREGAVAASDMRDQATRVASRTRQSALELIEDNPLLVAGVGLVIGALIAAAIPATETESRVLGSAGADLKERVRDLVDDGYQAATAVAGHVYERTLTEAENQGLSLQSAKTAADEVGEKLKTVVNSAAGSDQKNNPQNRESH